VPNRPKATPAVQTMMYFHAASRASLVRYTPTRNTVDKVVASTDTHIMMMLLEVTARIIENTNRLKNT
jgi:hypothetical protein